MATPSTFPGTAPTPANNRQPIALLPPPLPVISSSSSSSSSSKRLCPSDLEDNPEGSNRQRDKGKRVCRSAGPKVIKLPVLTDLFPPQFFRHEADRPEERTWEPFEGLFLPQMPRDEVEEAFLGSGIWRPQRLDAPLLGSSSNGNGTGSVGRRQPQAAPAPDVPAGHRTQQRGPAFGATGPPPLPVRPVAGISSAPPFGTQGQQGFRGPPQVADGPVAPPQAAATNGTLPPATQEHPTFIRVSPPTGADGQQAPGRTLMVPHRGAGYTGMSYLNDTSVMVHHANGSSYRLNLNPPPEARR